MTQELENAQKQELSMNPRLNSDALTNIHELETIEAALGDFETEADIEAADAVEELEMTELSDENLGAVESMAAREEIYEAQPDGATVEEPVAALVAGTKPVREKKAKSAAAPKTKTVRNIVDLPANTFYLSTVAPPTDPEANKLAVISSRPTQTKIAEKFDNLFVSLAAGKKPSVYIMDCFKALDAGGEATSKSLVDAILNSIAGAGKSKGSNKNIGTARSQAGQIMNLFSVVGIADRTGQTLTLNGYSSIAAYLRAL